ncbi:MAG TPA: hypothetical protein VM529_13585 [Gemmata sp.]|nr:hypothetical protein [Gemmata sp.]
MKPAMVLVSEDAPEIVAAAKWWADVLRSGAKFDNGDDSSAGGLAGAMAMLSRPEFAADVLDKFEAELRAGMARWFNDRGGWSVEQPDWGSYGRCVSVDYGPCRVLSDALTRAGGRGNGITCFPWKTVMWVDPGKVTVRYGYAAPVTTIYHSED